MFELEQKRLMHRMLTTNSWGERREKKGKEGNIS
jgi:hypothetical protein